MGQIEAHSGVLLVRPEVKRRLGRPRPRWKDYIKKELQGNIMGVLGLD